MIYVPAKGIKDWKSLLAQPEKHWKDNYSAKLLAESWQNAKGFPEKVESLFKSQPNGIFENLKMTFGIPEYKVNLPGGLQASQSDLFVLARTNVELIPIMIEGKVDEHFGPFMSEWSKEMSAGKKKRLEFLRNLLNLVDVNICDVRYQLLHRTASAILTAKNYHAKKAVVLIHSFSSTNQSFDDYARFLTLYKLKAKVDEIVGPVVLDGIMTYWGWVKDNP